MLRDLLAGAAAALVVSCVACRVMMQAGPLDMPTEARKAHRAPTPTSGGVGVGLGFGAALIGLAMLSVEWRHQVSAEGVGLISIGAVFAYGFLALGFLDDAHPLGPRIKFAIFTALALGAVLSVGVVMALPIGGGASFKLGFWWGLLGSGLWMFTLVNSVNFMDGSNGLSMGAVAIGLCALAAIGLEHGAFSAAAMAACAGGALVGFLVWNYPNGRLFAGDSGALFAGAAAAIIALILIRRIGLSPFVPPVVFFPLLADVLLTLAWRARRGRSLLEGHAEHIYQIAIRAGWSHARVALAYWAAMAGCGVIAYAVSLDRDSPGPWIALAALAAVSLVISYLVRRYAAKRGILESQ